MILIKKNPYLISVAPMMDCTDRHERYFLRLISSHVRLYTEMITSQALIYGDANHLLAFHPNEHPLALQLGGSDPQVLAKCAEIGESFGYDEINLNIGCPSNRVQAGRFGACLMKDPTLVADCISAMQERTQLPITIKCRIGVDNLDNYEQLQHFVDLNAKAGCSVFIIHARKAWLSGLSPRQNRDVPPLQYEIVRKIKLDFPHLTIVINGGIKTVMEIEHHLSFVDGVMLGRSIYSNPYLLAEIQSKFFSANDMLTKRRILDQFKSYVQEQLTKGVRLAKMTRHILGLFQGQRGAALWRRHLSEQSWKKNVGIEIIDQALNFIEE